MINVTKTLSNLRKPQQMKAHSLPTPASPIPHTYIPLSAAELEHVQGGQKVVDVRGMGKRKNKKK